MTEGGGGGNFTNDCLARGTKPRYYSSAVLYFSLVQLLLYAVNLKHNNRICTRKRVVLHVFTVFKEYLLCLT